MRRRPAHRGQRRRQPGRAARGDGRHRARGGGARPSALDDPGPRRGAPEGRSGRLVGARSHRRDRGSGPRRLAAGRHHHGQDTGLAASTCRWCPSTTSRATSTPRGCWIRTSRTNRRRSSRSWRSSSAAATRSSSRCATTCSTGCWARPSTMRRARPSTRSAGCSACPIPAAPPSRRRPRLPATTTASFPRAWLGDTFDFSFSGLKTAARREVAEELGADRDVGPTEGDGRLPPSSVAELAYALPGFGRRRARLQDDCGPRRGIGARTIILGGGVAANSVLRERIAAGAASLGLPLVVPRPGLCTDNAAMIGAAGFFRARAGRSGGRSTWPRGLAQARRASSRCDDRPTTCSIRGGCRPSGVERYLRRHGLAARKKLQPEPPRRRPGARGHRRGGRARAGAARPGDRARPGHPDRRAARRAGANVTAVEVDRRLAEHLRTALRGAGDGSLTWSRRDVARHAAGRAGRAALRRRGQPAVPHHQSRCCTTSSAPSRGRSASC